MAKNKLLEKEGTVFVIVDMQDSLLNKCVNMDGVVKTIVKFAKFCDILGIPIVMTEQYPKGLGPTNRAVQSAVKNMKPIEKTSFSCFGAPEFRRRLRELKPRNLVLSGIETHVCISQTALDAVKRKYGVFILEDGVSSRSEDDRRAGIERIRNADGVISSMEMAMFEIMKSSEIPEFKQVVDLIK